VRNDDAVAGKGVTGMRILYEDNHILVAVKPQNILSQADDSGDKDFLTMVREYVKVKYNKPGEAYIGLVHRLDRPAGGVMVFARTSKAAARLAKLMKDGEFEKTYLAVAECGNLKDEGVLKGYLAKNRSTNNSAVVDASFPGAKYAELSYRILEKKSGYGLIEIDLVTGRPHQIRVQMAYEGAPLAGDYRYGGEKMEKLCLWSYRLGFVHPVKKEKMEFCCAPPDEGMWRMFSPAYVELSIE